MNWERRDYAHGTYTVTSAPWGFYRSARAMCTDGKVRTVKRIAETADTFISVPAAVSVNGRTVSGYVTFDDETVKFVAYTYGRNGHLLPGTKMPETVQP